MKSWSLRLPKCSVGAASRLASRKRNWLIEQASRPATCRCSASRRRSSLVKGPGSGRESAIRALQATGLEVNMIKDVTSMMTEATR